MMRKLYILHNNNFSACVSIFQWHWLVVTFRVYLQSWIHNVWESKCQTVVTCSMNWSVECTSLMVGNWCPHQFKGALRELLPKLHLVIHIEHLGENLMLVCHENVRKIVVAPHNSWIEQSIQLSFVWHFLCSNKHQYLSRLRLAIWVLAPEAFSVSSKVTRCLLTEFHWEALHRTWHSSIRDKIIMWWGYGQCQTSPLPFNCLKCSRDLT